MRHIIIIMNDQVQLTPYTPDSSCRIFKLLIDWMIVPLEVRVRVPIRNVSSFNSMSFAKLNLKPRTPLSHVTSEPTTVIITSL